MNSLCLQIKSFRQMYSELTVTCWLLTGISQILLPDCVNALAGPLNSKSEVCFLFLPENGQFPLYPKALKDVWNNLEVIAFQGIGDFYFLTLKLKFSDFCDITHKLFL